MDGILTSVNAVIIRASALAAGLFAILVWAHPAFSIDGQESNSSFDTFTDGRPPDFYTLGFVGNQSVCDSALWLLNRRASVPPGLRMPYDYAKIDTAFFLSTEASVAWDPKWLIIDNKTPRVGVLDTAIADLFNDDQPLVILRFELSVGGNLRHSIYGIPLRSRHEVLIESESRVEGLQRVEIPGPLSLLRPYSVDFDSKVAAKVLGIERPAWAGVFADIIRVEGKTYVLVTSALQNYRHNRVYLLEFFSRKDSRLVCEYRFA